MKFYRNTKGTAGYIAKKKKIQLFNTFLMAVIGVIIFLVGYFLNDMSNRNIFTIVAIVMALPGAKFLVSVLILLPFKGISSAEHEKVKKLLKTPGKVLADMAITSSEKVMYLSYIVLAQECVYALAGDKTFGKNEQDIKYIQSYLTKGVRGRGQNYTVKVFASTSEFEKAVAGIKEKEVNERQEKEVERYLLSLVI